MIGPINAAGVGQNASRLAVLQQQMLPAQNLATVYKVLGGGWTD